MRFELTLALQHMMSRKLLSGLITIVLIIIGLLYFLEFSLLFSTEKYQMSFIGGVALMLVAISLKLLIGKLRGGLYSNYLRYFLFLSGLLLVLLASRLGYWNRVAYMVGPFFLFLGILVQKPAKNKPSDSRLISIIAVITILGVVLGVMALIMVIAVMDGAQVDYKKRLLDQYTHIEVHAPFRGKLTNYKALMDVIAEDPDVVAVSPLLKHFGLLMYADEEFDPYTSQPSQIFGIDPKLEEKVSVFALDNKKLQGKRSPGYDEIVVGSEIARRMHLRLGDELQIATGRFSTPSSSGQKIPQRVPVKVVGIFTTGLYEVDKLVSYLSIPMSQEVNLMKEDAVDLVHMRLTDPLLAKEVKKRLQNTIAEKFGLLLPIRTWDEMNPGFFKALHLEKLVMFIILMLVIVVAGMNIVGTLILVTMEKTREIGILRAIGTPRRSISLTFILEGGIIGVIGTSIGLLLGLLGCYYLAEIVPIVFPEEVYNLDGIPVLVQASTVLTIVMCSMGVCLLSSVIPATMAARLNIVEALRYE